MKNFLSTGSTLLNLACSGKPTGGFEKGTYNFIVGDSWSGKTFLGFTCLAEATQNSTFDDYRLVYDNVEGGARMDIARFFGEACAKRVEPPDSDDEGPIYSEWVEDFYMHLDAAIKDGRPFVYILDSMDATSSESESKKHDERNKARQKNKESAGSYGDGKAKLNAAGIRSALSGLRDTGSILIILNQTRANIGAGLFESRKTRSGGHALTFYATLELWSSVAKQLKREINGKKRQVGIVSKVQIKKNRHTGRVRTVEIPILHSYGIDDIGGNIAYLIDEGRVRKKGVQIRIDDLDVAGTYSQMTGTGTLVTKIEEQGLEKDLQLIVADVWDDIESKSQEKRRPRY